MGFMDGLKSMKNAVTGGAAEVQVEIGDVRRGQPTPVRVHAVAKANADITAVYIQVCSTEYASFKETEYEDGEYETETESGKLEVFDERMDIAGPQKLQEGQQYTWEGSFTLPESVNPSFEGEIIEHEWEIQAALDMTGNDPDSGWKAFWVY